MPVKIEEIIERDLDALTVHLQRFFERTSESSSRMTRKNARLLLISLKESLIRHELDLLARMLHQLPPCLASEPYDPGGYLPYFQALTLLKYKFVDQLQPDEFKQFFDFQFPLYDSWLSAAFNKASLLFGGGAPSFDSEWSDTEVELSANTSQAVAETNMQPPPPSELAIRQAAAEESLKQLDRLQSFIRTVLAYDGDFLIFVLDRDFAIRSCSESVRRALGYPINELIGRKLAELGDHEAEQPILFDPNEAPQLINRRWEAEVPFKAMDGRKVLVAFSMLPIQYESGKIVGILGMGLDISEKRDLQEQLWRYTNDLQQIIEERSKDLDETEQRYRQLIEEINEGYFITQNGKLIFINRAFARITGFHRNELIGKNFLDLIVTRDDRAVLQWWNQIRSGKGSPPVEFMMKRKDGSKSVVECKAQLASFHDDPHIIGVLHDITAYKKMERKLRRYVGNLEKRVQERTNELESSLSEMRSMQFQLVQSEKLAGIGILAAGVAHEINNPLQALLLKSQYILKNINNQLKVKSSTRDMIEYINRMAEIVRELSNYARTVKNDQVGSVDLVEVIKESLELAYHTRSFGDIIVKRDFQPVPAVRGNKGQCQQIFINLIVNAIDAMEGKGSLLLRLRTYDDLMVVAEVEDTGCGITEENLDKIFAPLFTTKPSGRGTGIGLNVAYRIINQYGGDIKVESKVDEGSTFFVYFPIAESGSNEEDESE